MVTISIFLIAAVSVIGGYQLGKNEGRSTSIIFPVTSLKQVQPSPITTYMITPSPSSSITLSTMKSQKNFIIPTNGTIIEACSYPWDYYVETPSPLDIECLEFEANGLVMKKIQGGVSSSSIIVSSNKDATFEQRTSISSEIQKIYQTLTTEEYLNWQQKPKAPIVGGVMPHIKIYSGDLNKQYTVIIYTWGAEYSNESQQVKGMFEQLQSFSPPTKTVH